LSYSKFNMWYLVSSLFYLFLGGWGSFFLYKHKTFQIGNKTMQTGFLIVVSVVHQLLKYS